METLLLEGAIEHVGLLAVPVATFIWIALTVAKLEAQINLLQNDMQHIVKKLDEHQFIIDKERML